MRDTGIRVGVLSFVVVAPLLAVAIVFAQSTSGVTNLRIENLYATGVDILWETATPTDSTVYWGTAPGNYPYSSSATQRCDGGALVTNHCVRLSGLAQGTTYYYRVKSTNSSVDYQLDGAPFLAANTNTSNPGGVGVDISPPSVPTALAATALSSSQITVSWQAATDDVGVTSYKVFRDGMFIASVGVTNYTDTNLAAATTYSYRVKAIDASGKESDLSAPTSAQTASASNGGALPVAPSGFTAVSGVATYGPVVNFAWNDVANEDTYQIYQRRSGTEVGGWTLVFTAARNAIAGSIPAPSSGIYDYYVKACNGIGCSPESNIANVPIDVCTESSCDQLPPSAPTGLSVPVLLTSRIDLAWSQSTDNVGVSGYKVYRNGAYVATVQTTTYSDSSVGPGITYSYSIIAFDGAGHLSESSPTLTVTTPYHDVLPTTTTPTTVTSTTATPVVTTPTTTTSPTLTTMTNLTTTTQVAMPQTIFPSNSVGVFVSMGDARCNLNTPLTLVTFAAIPERGATFRVTNKTSATVQEIAAGTHLFPNGSYLWEALPYPGYVINGTKKGGFTLSARCDSFTRATMPPPADTSGATSPPAPPAPSSPTKAATPQPPIVRLNEELLEATEATTSPTPPPELLSPQPATAYIAYCDNPAHRDACAHFVATKIDAAIPSSVAAGVSSEDLLAVLPSVADFPVPIETPEQFAALCAQTTFARRCADLLVQANVLSEETARLRLNEVIDGQERITHMLNERVGARAMLDTDHDGITDYDEINLYHTDHKSPDTNGDGVLDGDHLLIGTDPLYVFSETTATTSMVGGLLSILTGTSTTVPIPTSRERPIVFENPKFAGEKKPELLAIERIEPTRLGESRGDATTTVHLAGRALPNSFVTIYIFSEPIIVVVKADETGTWEYTLERELPDGTHEAWSAIVDVSGRILAKSEPLTFVKVAEAVTVGSAALAPEADQPGFFSGTALYFFLGILLFVVVLAFFLIGLIVKRGTQSSTPEDM